MAMKSNSGYRARIGALALWGSALLLAGCNFFAGPEPMATPTRQALALIPTFTPTPMAPDTPTATATPIATDTPTAPPAPTATATTTKPSVARFTVTNDVVNVRRGPGTAYTIIGTVNKDAQFDISGKNQAGDWYEFCCVNDQKGWIFGQLVQVDNPRLIALAQNIPAPPPPPPPTNTPVPAAPPPPNPCANRNCLFKLRDGPKFTRNQGRELKLTLGFVHGGHNDEQQGSYFVGLRKGGVGVPVSDKTRSERFSVSTGFHGEYNYEYKIGSHQLPGGTVAGAYTIWVIDGNGNPASQDFTFTVLENQGEVWIVFDQN